MRTFPEFSRPAWLRYGAAVVLSAAALLMTGLFWPIFHNISFTPSFLAVLLAGWFGGGGPCLLAVLAEVAGLDYFFLSPASLLRPGGDPYEIPRIIVFLVVGGLASLMFRQLRATRRDRARLVDVAERERAAAQNAAGELERILESITDGFCSLDRAYQYKYVNHQAEKILGRPRGELLGKNALQGSPMSEAGIGAVRKAMEEGETCHAQSYNPTLRRWLATDIYPSPDGVVVLFRDITDRKQAQEELRRMAAIVESSEDAIISKDLEGIITSWNAGAERLFGYTADEIVGQPISRLMPRDHDDMRSILERIRRGERVEHYETVRVRKDGGLVPVWLSVSPIKDESGNIVGAAKIARDVTEQKKQAAERERLYKEAQEAARVREEFLSVAGHELRTPLTSLQFQLHTLRRRVQSGQQDKAAELLDRSAAQVQRLSRLTEELLDVTRITTGRLELELEETDLGQIVRDVVERHKDSTARAGCDLHVVAPAGITGNWDRSRLDQVVTNLLSNAVKFGNGKPIEIRADLDTSWASLTVRDQGIGISPEDQAKIFERFERAVSKRSYGGLGLGLWITRQIVDAHHGRIEVTSEPGRGSTFRIELPLQTPEGEIV